MKFIENLFIKIFSLIVLILSILIILVEIGLVNIKVFSKLVVLLVNDPIKAKITLFVCIAFILMSLKILLTRRGKPKNGKDGIILENGSGRLIISKESLDNLISNASKEIPGAENISSKTYLDLDQNLRVFVTITVSSDVSIKDISTRLQAKIKSAIKQTADLDVSEVNVKIKNISNKKSKKDRNIIKETPKVEPVIINNNDEDEEEKEPEMEGIQEEIKLDNEE